MNIHEYQAKKLFKDYGLSILNGGIANSPEEAVNIAKKINSKKWIIKAQIHAGGRGKGGGIKIAKSLEEVKDLASSIIGMNLITPQTGEKGKKVLKVYIEEACEIVTELYLGIVLDRSKGKFVMMASTEGGMDIEKVAEETPEKIFKVMLVRGGQIFRLRCSCGSPKCSPHIGTNETAAVCIACRVVFLVDFLGTDLLLLFVRGGGGGLSHARQRASEEIVKADRRQTESSRRSFENP